MAAPDARPGGGAPGRIFQSAAPRGEETTGTGAGGRPGDIAQESRGVQGPRPEKSAGYPEDAESPQRLAALLNASRNPGYHLRSGSQLKIVDIRATTVTVPL